MICLHNIYYYNRCVYLIFCALRSTVSQAEDVVRDVVPSSLLNVLCCWSFVIHSLQGMRVVARV